MTTTEARTSRCVRGHEVAHDSEVCSTCGAPIELQPHVRKAVPIAEILKRSDEYYAHKPPPPVEAVAIEPSDTADPAAEAVDAPVPEVEAEWPASAPKAEPDVGNAKPIAEILKRSPPAESEEKEAEPERAETASESPPKPARRGLVPRKPPAPAPRPPSAPAMPEAPEDPAPAAEVRPPPPRPVMPMVRADLDEIVVVKPAEPSSDRMTAPAVVPKRTFLRSRSVAIVAIVVLAIVVVGFLFFNPSPSIAVSEECKNSFAYASVHPEGLPRTAELCGSADEWKAAAADYPKALAGRSLEAICASMPQAAACRTNEQ